LAGFAVFFLVLARMLFPAERHTTAHPNTNTNPMDDTIRKDDRP
jgi:hypothetical protein